MRAFYNAAGLRLLAEGIDSPESIDVSDPCAEYAIEHGCMGCGARGVPLHAWSTHVECAACLGILPTVTVLLAAFRVGPGVRKVVADVEGVTIGEESRVAS